MSLMPSQVFPISFISFSTVRRHVILGRPRLRFPSGEDEDRGSEEERVLEKRARQEEVKLIDFRLL